MESGETPLNMMEAGDFMSPALRNKSKGDWKYEPRIMTKNVSVKLLRREMTGDKGGIAVSARGSRLCPKRVGLGFRSFCGG